MKIDQYHLALLRDMAESMEVDPHYGFVPQFEVKRPFGNSGARTLIDAAEAVGEELDYDDLEDPEVRHEWEQKIRECTDVLKAILNSDLTAFIGQEAK